MRLASLLLRSRRIRTLAAAGLGALMLPGFLRAETGSRLLFPAAETVAPRVIHDWDGVGGWKKLVVAATGQPEAGTAYTAPGLDLQAYAEVAVPVRNFGARSLRVSLRVTDPASGP